MPWARTKVKGIQKVMVCTFRRTLVPVMQSASGAPQTPRGHYSTKISPGRAPTEKRRRNTHTAPPPRKSTQTGFGPARPPQHRIPNTGKAIAGLRPLGPVPITRASTAGAQSRKSTLKVSSKTRPSGPPRLAAHPIPRRAPLCHEPTKSRRHLTVTAPLPFR